MERDDVDRWIEAYVQAWESNEPDDIQALFTEDARYFTAPYRQPWVGAEAITAGWLGRKDQQGTWSFRWDLLAIAEGAAFVQGVTTYDDAEYWNLWVIRLGGDGRAWEFVEWWMQAVDPEKTD